MTLSTRCRSLWVAALGLWTQACTGATTGPPIAAYSASKTAVLALDLQRDFLEDDARMPIARSQVEPLLRASNAVLDGARVRGWPVVVIANEFSPTSWLQNAVQHGAAVRGTPGAEIDPRVHAIRDLYVPKESRDAFTNPALDAWLRAEQVDHLVVLGVMADACVRATVLGARNRGYRVTVVRGAIGARSDRALASGLAQMAEAGARVVSLEEALR